MHSSLSHNVLSSHTLPSALLTWPCRACTPMRKSLDEHYWRVQILRWSICLTPNNFPRQTNGIDCGVFSLFALRCMLEGLPWTFCQADVDGLLRPMLMLESMTGELLYRSAAQIQAEAGPRNPGDFMVVPQGHGPSQSCRPDVAVPSLPWVQGQHTVLRDSVRDCDTLMSIMDVCSDPVLLRRMETYEALLDLPRPLALVVPCTFDPDEVDLLRGHHRWDEHDGTYADALALCGQKQDKWISRPNGTTLTGLHAFTAAVRALAHETDSEGQPFNHKRLPMWQVWYSRPQIEASFGSVPCSLGMQSCIHANHALRLPGSEQRSIYIQVACKYDALYASTTCCWHARCWCLHGQNLMLLRSCGAMSHAGLHAHAFTGGCSSRCRHRVFALGSARRPTWPFG